MRVAKKAVDGRILVDSTYVAVQAALSAQLSPGRWVTNLVDGSFSLTLLYVLADPTFLIEGELFLPPLDLYFKYRTVLRSVPYRPIKCV